MRYAKFEKQKTVGQLKKEYGMTCVIPGCGKSLTHLLGPGSSTLCIEHQLLDSNFGGPGVAGRHHTYHRTWTCRDCGKDIEAELSKKFPTMRDEDPDKFNQLLRARTIGDHIIRRADGGLDTVENVQPLCLDCNSDKTMLSEDYRKGDSLSSEI